MVRRVVVAGLLLCAILAFGTIGYVLIEGWSPLDSLYMTVITIGTVGFREIAPLSRVGQLFTMVLILTGIGALGFSLGAFLDFLAEGRLRGLMEGRRMTRSIESLDKHHIVAGLGRVGSVAAQTLADERKPFVAVEIDPDAAEGARRRGWLVVQGDATNEAVLVEAGVRRASSLLTTLDRDGPNMFVTVTAKTLNPELFVVTRSEHEESEPVMLKAGADRVITPNVIGGRRMANLVTHPFVSDYLDLVTHGHDLEYRLMDFELPATSPLANRSIRESMVRDRFGTYILAVRRPDGAVDTNPSMDELLLPGSVLVVLGTPQQLEALSREV